MALRTVSRASGLRCLSTTVALRMGSGKDMPESEVVSFAATEDKEELSEVQKQASLKVMDPFESVPLRRLASYLGETFSPKLEEIQEAERQKSKPKAYTTVHEPPEIPHVLPLTRWAAQSQRVRETLVVDEKKRQRARLSWYHPDDTMVPRGWFSKGLLEDIKYYRPFWKKKE